MIPSKKFDIPNLHVQLKVQCIVEFVTTTFTLVWNLTLYIYYIRVKETSILNGDNGVKDSKSFKTI